ncbi:hypothetical protein [Roseateles flavus]|uniref:Uncharacterized protein n=1 Tax=Roseateles flavus TaxID=3149041 RepID=A0ABV0GBS4_9BURK
MNTTPFLRRIVWALICALVIASMFMVVWRSGQLASSDQTADEASPWAAGAVVPVEEARRAHEPSMNAAVPATEPLLGSLAAASANAPVTLANWTLYPGGLVAAADQALRLKEGKRAYELVRIMDACDGLPARLEGTRQNLADLQTQGVLKPSDRHLAESLLASMQRDQSHCQVLNGDQKSLRRQLLEVAVRDGVEGSGVTLLLSGADEPWVASQVLREAEHGEGMALRMLASGDVPQATRLQREAARDALVRGARDPELRSDASLRIQQHLAAVERHAAVEDWRADPGNAAKAATADAAYVGKGAPQLQASSDPQVRALADVYVAALKKRLAAQGS